MIFTFFLSCLIWYLSKLPKKTKRTKKPGNDISTTEESEKTVNDDDRDGTTNTTPREDCHDNDYPSMTSPRPMKVRLSSNPFNPPSPRFRPGMAVHNGSGMVYLHGGVGELSLLSDTHRYNPQTFQWETFTSPMEPRSHCSMAATANGLLVLFGGSTEKRECTSHLYVMDLSLSNKSDSNTTNAKWQYVPKERVNPVARRNHAMCSSGNDIVVFGGVSANKTLLNDLWILDTTKMRNESGFWTKLKKVMAGDYWPAPKEDHVMAVLDATLYVLGGRISPSSRKTSPGLIETYSFRKHRWTPSVTCGPHPDMNGAAFSSLHPISSRNQLVTISSEELSQSGIFNRVDVLDTSVTPLCWSRVDLDWYGDWTMVPGWKGEFGSCCDEEEGLVYIFGGRTGDAYGQVSDSLLIMNFNEEGDE
eukprot:CAMPEP_0172485752 /NCGR_PEP_ID=MMETSP1066-20121228/13920_1 /TAXON_ID=671091 /ORGANISM="Coscinodiscus wailesii, Strain CCMP2513" /LENGTH=417 /DNA_ID=CAMNT_0013251197 /DNA_START=167 /DNA_END=1420 /DNA_ORIENTATION=-